MLSRPGTRATTLALSVLFLGLCAPCRADQVSLELADWVRRAEAECCVNPLITFSALCANPTAYAATRAVRVEGVVTDVVAAENSYVYASVASDCGARLALWTWEHPYLYRGLRVRAVVEVPRDPAALAQPLVALAWADRGTFESGAADQQVQSQPAGYGPRLTNPQPSTDPYVATGPRTVYSSPGGGASYYGTDAATGLPVYGPPQQQGQQASAQTATPTDAAAAEQFQYAAYCNLVTYYNRSLPADQVHAIVGNLFQACGYYGVPRPLMAALIYAESCYDPRSTSHSGAMGLTQLMPGTARGLGVKSGYDIQQNIWGGTHYLSDMLRRYARGDTTRQVSFAVAAYNAGPGAVDRAGGIPRNSETPPYVRKVIATYSELWSKGYR